MAYRIKTVERPTREPRAPKERKWAQWVQRVLATKDTPGKAAFINVDDEDIDNARCAPWRPARDIGYRLRTRIVEGGLLAWIEPIDSNEDSDDDTVELP